MKDSRKKALLEVRCLKKYFPIFSGLFRRESGVVKAVDGIDFTVYEESVLGIVGESGSGKSTAARTAIRLIEPTEGKVVFQGKNLFSLNPIELKKVRQKIQIVFQDPFSSLNPRKMVGQNIGEALLYHGLVSSVEEQKERVIEILESIGLSEDYFNRYPHELSGGQQQRVCIGRAIAMRPQLIICDEAVSSLDISVQAQILNLLEDLRKKLGFSYLFISHDLAVIRHFSDDVAVMYAGKIVEYGATKELFHSPKHPYSKKLLSLS